jgi:iron complex transport system substrate-binding protein
MRTSRPALAILLSALTVGACGSDGTTTGAVTTGAAVGAFPVTVENCGQRYTFDRPPSRAVTMNQHVTEVLLALGLVDRMVGTAYLDSTIRPDLAADYAKVPVLAKEYPSKEQVVAADPDVVIGGYASAFADDAAGPRDALAALGINSYLTAGYCPDYTGRNSIDLVRSDIEDIGRMFGVSAAAERLVEKIQAPIDRATMALTGVEPVKVFVYDSGTDLAFTAGGREMTTALLGLAGGTNVFADIPKNFAEVSWEEVVARDPEVIVILNYGDTTVEQKERDLAAHPVASTLHAVRDRRYVVVDLTDVVPGIRNGDAVATLAAGLHPDRF